MTSVHRGLRGLGAPAPGGPGAAKPPEADHAGPWRVVKLHGDGPPLYACYALGERAPRLTFDAPDLVYLPRDHLAHTPLLLSRHRRSQKRISGYERDVYTPSTDVLIRLAELFDVSLDYLAFDDRPDTRAGVLIADRELVEKLAAIDRLQSVLEGLLLKHDARCWIKTGAGA